MESESVVEVLRRSSTCGATAAVVLRTTSSRASSGGSHVNSASMSVTTSVMDFNAAPDDHIQEVLGAAKEDLKRLRDKVNKARDKDRLSISVLFLTAH